MNVSRQRRLLDIIEARARKTEADLTAALAMQDLEPLRRLRKAALCFVTDAAAAVRELAELDSELTPVQIPTGKSSSGFKAVHVADILAEGRKP